MIKTGYLGKFEVFALLVITMAADLFLSYPQQFVLHGASAGWMIPFISMIICLGIWRVVAPVFTEHVGENLLSLTKRYLGQWGMRLVILLIVSLLLVDTAITMRIFTENVVTTVLPRTPISIVAAPFLLVLLYYAYTGIEAISRVAWFLMPWLLLGIALLLALIGIRLGEIAKSRIITSALVGK